MSYQFIHIESVSRAGRDLHTKRNGKKIKVGNISTNSVLGEAGRFNGFISHIENPLNPVILFGNKEKGIEDVRQKIEDWVDGTTDARGHKVRIDANALLSGVISWPPINDGEDKDKYIGKLKTFEQAMLLWLKKEYGEDLVLVLRHDDEPFKGYNDGKIHYHWHYFCVKKPGKKFDLHPGFAARCAKDVSRQQKKGMSADEIRAAMNEGKYAYRKAMSSFQDRFYHELGKFHDLERMGPGRLRRSRNEQVEFEALLEQEITASKDAKAKTDKILVEAERKAENLTKIAEATAKDIKSAAWNMGQKITKDAEKNADEIIQIAEDKAKEIKNDAWTFSHDKINASMKKAASILDMAKGFVNILLKEVSKLPGGERVVNWAQAFIKLINQPANEPSTEKKENIQNKSDVRKSGGR